MTSNCSFRRLMTENLKRRIWLILLSLYLYLTYIIDYILAQSGQAMSFGDEQLGPANRTVLLITVILGIVSAFQGFGFLFSEEKTDFYFAMPVKRRRLFFSVYINGVLISIIPCVFSRLICYFVEGSRSQEALLATWMGILINLAGFLLIYHIGLCVILLTGHIVIAAVGTLIAFYYGTIAFGFMIQKFSSAFFFTYYKTDMMNSLSMILSPYALYGKLSSAYGFDEMGFGNMAALLPLLVFVFLSAAALFLLIYMLFQKRPAEASGRSLAFDKSHAILKAVLSIPVALIAGYYMMRCSPSSRSLLLLLVGLLFACFTINGILEVIFQFDIKGFFTHWKHFIFISVFCIAAAAGFYFDIWNYDDYMPDIQSVDSAAAAIWGLDDAFDISELETPRDMSSKDIQLEEMTLTKEAKVSLLEWVEEIRSEPEFTEKPLTYVAIAYHLFEGNTVYRKYPVYSAEQLDSFDKIYESEDYKKGAFPLYDTDSIGTRHFVWSNGIESYHLDLSDEENETLLFSCIADDLKNLNLNDIKQAFPIGTLTLAYPSGSSGDDCLIYPTFTHTLNYLESLGIPAYKTIQDYEITHIQVFEKHKDTNIFGKVTLSRNLVLDTKEQQEIQNYVSSLIPDAYAVNPLLNPAASQYQVLVSMSDELPKTIQIHTMTLKNGKMADTLSSYSE